MQKKKVLIIGASGMLGHMVHKYLEHLGSYELYNSVYRYQLNEKSIVLDAKNQIAVADLFKKTKPDIVINCVGALVQESLSNPTSAIYLNALFPYILRDLSNEYAAKLIHISTDCVFSGKRGLYREDDLRDADDVYGRSKALGEIFDPPHCTLRTSIIGPELKNGTGLFQWFMNYKGDVKGYTQAFWSGVTTLELARSINKVIVFELQGLYHVTNGRKISKYDLLNLFNKLKKTQNKIIPYDGYFSDKSLEKTKKFDFEVPGYDEMIKSINYSSID